MSRESDLEAAMSKVKKAAALAIENEARQVALSLGLGFACFVLLTQFVRLFFG